MTQPNDTRNPINPSGLCLCGCGRKTTIATKDWPQFGHVKGQPKRFCRGHHGKRVSPVDWIEEDRGFTTPCWIWQRGKFKQTGYGAFWHNKQPRLAHRMIYEREVGPIPEGAQIDHLCRVRLCVNPDHLEPVTNQVNAQRSTQSKLTPDTVRQIRRLAGSMSHQKLAHMFGVSDDTISSCIRRKTWGNIE